MIEKFLLPLALTAALVGGGSESTVVFSANNLRPNPQVEIGRANPDYVNKPRRRTLLYKRPTTA